VSQRGRNRNDGETLESPICGGIFPYDVALGAGRSLDLIKRRYVRHYLFGSQSDRKAGER